MALDVAEEVMSCSLFQERYARSTIMGANVDIQQHSTSDNIHYIGMGDSLREIGKQDRSFGKFVVLLALKPRLGVIVSAPSIIEPISTLWHECKVIVYMRVCMNAI